MAKQIDPPIPRPAVDSFLSGLTNLDTTFEENAAIIYDRMRNSTVRVPFYSSGARALIKLGGKPVGVCQNFRWNLSYGSTPVQSIDTNIAWDISVDQLTVVANLAQIMDPTKGPEHEALFSIMSASVHQPLVELQVLDKSGTSIVLLKGMFVGINGNVALGSVSSWNANFVGTTFQHWVSNSFKPYSSVAAGLNNLTNGLQNLTSDLSGGLF